MLVKTAEKWKLYFKINLRRHVTFL